MREIKFRAWCPEEKKMYQDVRLLSYKDKGISSIESIKMDMKSVGPYSKDYVVMQYTGVKDIEGKDIYEGDILLQKTTEEFKKYNSSVWERKYIVEFGEYDWRESWAGNRTVGFYLKSKISHVVGINQSDMLDPNYPFKIIGDIYQNPELLK